MSSDPSSPLQGGKAKGAYFRAAEGMSLLSDHRCRMGCVVVRGHRIISSGHNSASKRHAFQAKLDRKFFGCECAGYLHAETDALIPLIRNGVDLSNASLYVFRSMKDGSTGLARPCPRCMSVIKSCGIKVIHYTTPDGYATETIKL